MVLDFTQHMIVSLLWGNLYKSQAVFPFLAISKQGHIKNTLDITVALKHAQNCFVNCKDAKYDHLHFSKKIYFF